jgi:proteic killer suppression protein
MIRSFRDSQTMRLFQRYPVRKLGADVRRSALRKLRQLDAAATLDDLRVPPENHLEKLVRDRQGQVSIRINDQWRICFRWISNDAHEVEITDYH